MKLFGFAMAMALAVSASAQWPKKDAPPFPKLPNGKPNLTAPTPRQADGKPDLSGVWATQGGYTGNIAKDLKPGDVEFTPWGEALYKHRVDTDGKDDPQAYCVLSGVPREDVVPYPFKILHTTNKETMIIYEALHTYRQVFMDGRPLPSDPNPAWMGYSVGRWDGDTLVVDSSGFTNEGWIDNSGHPNSDALHVTERFHRVDYGHIDLNVTVEDPKAYKKPWTVALKLVAQPEDELIEYVCSENEKDLKHLVGK